MLFGTKRPSGWDEMTYEQQQEWQKQEQVRQDLEYDRDQAEENRQHCETQAYRERESARQTINGLREDYSILSENYDNALKKLNQAEQFIKSKGLWEEYCKPKTEGGNHER